MANTFKKSDAIDFAHNIRLMIDALVDEDFSEEEAKGFVTNLMIAQAGKNTTLF